MRLTIYMLRLKITVLMFSVLQNLGLFLIIWIFLCNYAGSTLKEQKVLVGCVNMVS